MIAETSNEVKRLKAVEYIQKWLGTPLVNDSQECKFSCSGIINEALKGCGLLRRADKNLVLLKLHDRFKANQISPQEAKPGCLIFWYIKEEIKHVDMLIGSNYVVGTCLCEERGACVKMNHINYQCDLKYEIVDPFK